MKNKTINALIDMGMHADTKGFGYIVEAMVLFEEEEWREGKITALYYGIAKKKNTTPSRVERAIRHAFGETLKNGNQEVIEKYFSFCKPTNGNLLHVLYLRLMQEE